MKIRLLLLILILSISYSHSQDTIPKKQLQIKRTNIAPKIDGVLDDKVWEDADIATDFIQFRPDMGKAATEDIKTIVKLAYDDTGIYVSAYMYDDPSLISKQFTSRDNFGQSDFFLIVLNPNNDAQNDTEFFVFSSGTQADAVANPNSGEDFSWNAVWDSAVKINDDGWSVEMKIPYRALRFSTDVETWGLQFHRRFRRNNEQYTWNPLDVTKGNIGLYHGELKGIKDIHPPVRLNLYPFASTVFDNMARPQFNLGMDVKYGITENITLDATLIPDFSQAGFDNLSLNLGPFEQTFSEQRQFFTEGVDLFSKGNLFFSRRVGSAPTGSVDLAEDEELVDYPNEVKVLNAVKVSGRTKNGLGIGFFNAITEKTDASIRNNVTGEVRKETVEPFTNYNILVLDQQFNGNSSIGIVNTNVLREGSFRDANVTALVGNISNKRNTYNIRADVKMSNRNLSSGTETGLSSFFFIRKSHGKVRYSFDHRFSDEEFNINDLGLNFRNNLNNFGVDASYQIFEATEKLNQFRINGWYNYRRLYRPSTFTGQNAGINVFGNTKKTLMAFGGNLNYQMGKQFDFFEPRDFANKRFFIFEDRVNGNVWISTNYNKPFAIDANVGGALMFEDVRTDYSTLWFGISPRFQFNDKFLVSYSFDYQNELNDRGYANNSNNLDNEIVFGERDQKTITNSVSGSYNFDPFNSLNLTFRNYWTTVHYDANPFFLQDNGRLLQSDDSFEDLGLGDSNVNFSTWNIDLSYSWQFAPGSFLTALYRNQLFNSNTRSDDSFVDSLNNLLDQDMQHILSLRLQYFIDYSGIKQIFKKRDRNAEKLSRLSRASNSSSQQVL
ncbi:DUF5916 domain-containing protein [uncultured Psychroserpens sp.]|uniref:DUF5916 domain-containing protein n=1 Tax=uncultured Psychroserpens sp. TaxID=255436 RepID=UPI0026339AAB|nr:DUF5916 domain-containing protein [uncultured Psychroserpens sp.]